MLYNDINHGGTTYKKGESKNGATRIEQGNRGIYTSRDEAWINKRTSDRKNKSLVLEKNTLPSDMIEAYNNIKYAK